MHFYFRQKVPKSPTHLEVARLKIGRFLAQICPICDLLSISAYFRSDFSLNQQYALKMDVKYVLGTYNCPTHLEVSRLKIDQKKNPKPPYPQDRLN